MMKKQSSTEPVRNDLIQSWWWFDSGHAAEKSEAALAWETLRRTRSYRALWREFKKEPVPLLQHQGKPTLAEEYQHMHLFQRVREAVGKPYFDYMMKGFDPDLTWLELEEHQRLTARGYIKEVRGGFALRKIAHTEFFRKLLLQSPGRYVFVNFDTRGARDALLQAFDREMIKWLGTKPAVGTEVDASYWEKILKGTERFAILWNPDDRTPVEFWTPEVREANMRLKANEQTVVPSQLPAFAIFLASARHNPATIRAAFHTQLKVAHFRIWHPQCVGFWKTLTIETHKFPRNPDGTKRIELDERGHPVRQKVVRHLFDPTKHLPFAKKPTRSARRKDLWLGLAANDVVEARVTLGKSSNEGEFLLKQSPSYHTLHNAQRSAKGRLDELDEAAGRLDKNLAHWNDQSLKLEAMGFFKAAAGEDPSGA